MHYYKLYLTSYTIKNKKTRAVLFFATEHKSSVTPCMRSLEKVNLNNLVSSKSEPIPNLPKQANIFGTMSSGHRIGRYKPFREFAEVGQLKVNNIMAMYHQFVNGSAMFDQEVVFLEIHLEFRYV